MEQVLKLISTTCNLPQRAVFESECLALLEKSDLGNIPLHPSSEEVRTLKKIFFDGQAEMALFSAKTEKRGGTFRVTREIQYPVCYLFDTGAGLDLIMQAIIPSSLQNRIQH